MKGRKETIRKNLYLDADIKEWLESQPNEGVYISQLIREDSRKRKIITEDDVVDVLRKLLKNNNLKLDVDSKEDKSRNDKIIKNAIGNSFESLGIKRVK